MDRRLQVVCVWSILAFAVLFGIGCFVLAGFIPPPSPAATAQAIAHLYCSKSNAIRIGCTLMMLGTPFILSWGSAIAMQVRRMERGVPILTYMMVACDGFAVMNVALTVVFWAAAAFRPDDVSPDITRALNDIGWFLFNLQWPVFCVWFLCIAVATLRDRNVPRIFPRWVAYVNVSTAVLSAPYGLTLFFKEGPLSGRGAIGFFLPTVVTFAWLLVMSIVAIRAINAIDGDTSAAVLLERDIRLDGPSASRTARGVATDG
jgi:hypothetical protein